ncbi:MAG TPA: OmpA family protein [Phycisphaerales bacterium]|nr:OmpA family protein [Phycisphaerales bacterium]
MFSRSTLTKLTAVALAALGLGLGGCQVNHDTYDSLQSAYNALKAENVRLADDNNGLRASLDDMRSKIGNGSDAAADAIAMNAKLRSQNDELARKLADLNNRLADIKFEGGPLDASTDAALQELARQFPDVLQYDSARGMLKFTSDVTFASGDYSLTEAGRRAVREFARIVDTVPAAAQYDILVAGHTDTQRVRPVPGRNFRNNAELSAFRALSVREEMMGAGVNPWRVGAVAFGETRPATQNTSSGNTPQNRRVEVYLTKGNYNGLTAKPVPAAPMSPTPAAATPARTGTTPGASTPTPTPAGSNEIEIGK